MTRRERPDDWPSEAELAADEHASKHDPPPDRRDLAATREAITAVREQQAIRQAKDRNRL